ncbi:MAG: hypothetical protein AAAFM81_15090 [Pseudomonadota bacterium]
MRTLLAFLLLTVSSAAISGGWSWEVTVNQFTLKSEQNAVIVIAVPEGSELDYRDCRSMQVTIRFRPDAVFKTANEQDILTLASHKEALSELQVAYESSEKIRFGSMGTGLKASLLSSCAFISNGLAVLKEYDGATAVYSFYNPI